MCKIKEMCVVKQFRAEGDQIDHHPQLRVYFGPDMFREPEAYARWLRGGE